MGEGDLVGVGGHHGHKNITFNNNNKEAGSHHREVRAHLRGHRDNSNNNNSFNKNRKQVRTVVLCLEIRTKKH